MHDHIHPLTQHIQIRIRYQCGHLHNGVLVNIQTRHFQVNPHNSIMLIHIGHRY